MRPAMKSRPDNQLELRFACRQEADASVGRVVSLVEARRRRDEQEERRLEQLVIERWTGRGEREA